jgi:hypothetical protein
VTDPFEAFFAELDRRYNLHLVPRVRVGTVAAAASPVSYSLTLPGETTARTGVPSVSPVCPRVGQLVRVEMVADQPVIVDVLGGPVIQPVVDYWSIGGATGTTTSGSNVTLATAAASLVKLSAATRVRVALHASFFPNLAANTEATFAVGIGGTDYDVFSYFANTQAVHVEGAGVRYVTGVAAGTYTVTLRWRRTAGTGTLTRDANDVMSAEITEVP